MRKYLSQFTYIISILVVFIAKQNIETSMEMKVEIVAREIIKPSSPTPNQFRIYKFCSRDQYSPHHYIPAVFFYANPTRDVNHEELVSIRSQRLRETLSETLTRFYPLAGRLRDNLFINCNDEGVDYLEARVTHCRLSDILEQPKAKEMYRLLEPDPEDFNKNPLLFVQLNFFPCGGMALCVRMSHKIADGVAYGAFVKAWSDIALGSSETIMTEKIVTKRFVIDPSKVATLKAKATSTGVQQPTHIEAVTAALLKCATVGAETDVPGLVCQLRKGVQQSTDNNFTAEKTKLLRLKGEAVKVYRHGNWRRFGLYELNFGWGKPTYTTVVLFGAPIGIGLLDTRDGDGIEVWMTLLKEDMAVFESDQELLAFALPNPSALEN
ncbi:salutaridinol 7-O-acetyltransferase-like [Camellia sinensis]|uniref:salutaridinol 7-O-acetyltransferase-like n=1 Tax=Camellia sinensis TaxID=4442 RepID=UPI0010362B90|nr:salutaridinol 7-O-acetyltransferase-like [Camellia sinensis]